MDRATEVDSKEYGLQCEILAVSWPVLKDQQKDRKYEIEGDNCPAERMPEFAQRKQREGDRQDPEQRGGRDEGPRTGRGKAKQGYIKRGASRQHAE